MNYTVLSRSKAKALSYHRLSKPTVIISITDLDSDKVLFAKNEQIKGVIRLSFDDVDANSFGSMTCDDADRIVAFCLKWLPKTDLIVHCEAGVSRSAGVCAAIMKWYEGSDTMIFNNPYFRPNMHCYRKVLNAFVKNERNLITRGGI